MCDILILMMISWLCVLIVIRLVWCLFFSGIFVIVVRLCCNSIWMMLCVMLVVYSGDFGVLR